MWDRPLNWSTVRIWALQAGRPDELGVIWSGTLRAACSARPTMGELGDDPRALGSSQWMGVAPIYRASIRSASIHAIRCACGRDLDRKYLVHRGCRCELGTARGGHARRARATRTDPRPHRPGRPLPGAMSGRAVPHVGAGITTESSSPPTRERHFLRSTVSSHRLSASRSSRIHGSPIRRGLSPESRMRSVSHPTAS
jgi:hypothetical protein